ncbi:nicotinate-nucleotide adenylyltransferase [Ornithinibacillus sp. 4-3]|uniref:Probable nicotinate-nucleotide adenylyltransferase n=1 Tax=Ornithinibacillus sp. 4-3 TaxID=3231488 RepID=A0AB39HLY6_9BACI
MKKIGILGGTFDPPHLGHLIIGEQVRLALALDEIWFIPTHTPPHKQGAMVTARDRLRMVELATEDNPFFKVDAIEINRSGKSYSIDTVKALRKQNPTVDFYFIIGADMVEYLPKWHQIETLMELVTFVSVKRPGYKVETNYPVVHVEIPSIDISSSHIRNQIKRQQSVKYLIPEKVYAYMKEKNLYGNN